MYCGVSEYWIVNPDNREVQIYLFKDGDISNNKTYGFHDETKSFYFEGLSLSLNEF